jgi:Neuraminidase (sialidase)
MKGLGCGLLVTGLSSISAQETCPVGKTKADQKRNAELLSGYDYEKYTSGITGYTGMDLQRIGFLHWQPAVRTRIGPRGNYKAGLTQLQDGTLLAAVCRRRLEDKRFYIFIYQSRDLGETWKEIGQTELPLKEASLTALSDGSVLLTGQKPSYSTNKPDETLVCRSQDGGRTWKTTIYQWDDYPRNVIVEPDGSLLMIRAEAPHWRKTSGRSPHLAVCRSRDGGKTWQISQGLIDWDYAKLGEVSAVRLKDGRLLAALRRQIPGTGPFMEGFHDTVLTQSQDNGRHWSKPWMISNTAEVHTYLTVLKDGRILATYSNYHLPYGVFARMSKDGGKTWDHDNILQLALSADKFLGWPVTLQLSDRGLITSYAITAYLETHATVEQSPGAFVCELVRWRLP